MKLIAIVSSVSIITLLFVMDQSSVAMSGPVPGRCINNCWGAYNQCESVPNISPEEKMQCVKDRKKCIRSCGGARYRTLIALFKAAVKSLN